VDDGVVKSCGLWPVPLIAVATDGAVSVVELPVLLPASLLGVLLDALVAGEATKLMPLDEPVWLWSVPRLLAVIVALLLLELLVSVELVLLVLAALELLALEEPLF